MNSVVGDWNAYIAKLEYAGRLIENNNAVKATLSRSTPGSPERVKAMHDFATRIFISSNASPKEVLRLGFATYRDHYPTRRGGVDEYVTRRPAEQRARGQHGGANDDGAHRKWGQLFQTVPDNERVLSEGRGDYPSRQQYPFDPPGYPTRTRFETSTPIRVIHLQSFNPILPSLPRSGGAATYAVAASSTAAATAPARDRNQTPSAPYYLNPPSSSSSSPSPSTSSTARRTTSRATYATAAGSSSSNPVHVGEDQRTVRAPTYAYVPPTGQPVRGEASSSRVPTYAGRGSGTAVSQRLPAPQSAQTAAPVTSAKRTSFTRTFIDFILMIAFKFGVLPASFAYRPGIAFELQYIPAEIMHVFYTNTSRIGLLFEKNNNTPKRLFDGIIGFALRDLTKHLAPASVAETHGDMELLLLFPPSQAQREVVPAFEYAAALCAWSNWTMFPTRRFKFKEERLCALLEQLAGRFRLRHTPDALFSYATPGQPSLSYTDAVLRFHLGLGLDRSVTMAFSSSGVAPLELIFSFMYQLPHGVHASYMQEFLDECVYQATTAASTTLEEPKMPFAPELVLPSRTHHNTGASTALSIVKDFELFRWRDRFQNAMRFVLRLQEFLLSYLSGGGAIAKHILPEWRSEAEYITEPDSVVPEQTFTSIMRRSEQMLSVMRGEMFVEVDGNNTIGSYLTVPNVQSSTVSSTVTSNSNSSTSTSVASTTRASSSDTPSRSERRGSGIDLLADLALEELSQNPPEEREEEETRQDRGKRRRVAAKRLNLSSLDLDDWDGDGDYDEITEIFDDAKQDQDEDEDEDEDGYERDSNEIEKKLASLIELSLNDHGLYTEQQADGFAKRIDAVEETLLDEPPPPVESTMRSLIAIQTDMASALRKNRGSRV